ncbi:MULTISPECIES: hypothetical protein [Aeromonas]|uniref:hypothetical protein n=1 Tax=Aeromonas TaxID=642 RepID=UPI00160144C3|nr:MULTISPECIES: hypothetical protein [Aeromonas]
MRGSLKAEVLYSFLLGSVPVILARNQPGFSAIKALASLDPGDVVFNYFLYLLCIHLVIWFVNVQVLKTNQSLSNVFKKLHGLTYNLGFAIHGIYRALAGAVPVAMFFELEKHGLTQGWQRVTILSVVLAISCLFASVVLSKTTEYTAPRISFFG